MARPNPKGAKSQADRAGPSSTDLESIFGNPGLLKIELMRRGVTVVPDAVEALGRVRSPGAESPVSAAFGNSTDLDVVLPKNTWATIPLITSAPKEGRPTPFALTHSSGQFSIVPTLDVANAGLSAKVQVLPESPFVGKKTESGIPLETFGSVHGNYLALSPISDCSFLATPNQCQFCSVANIVEHRRVPPEDIVEAIRIAKAAQKIDIVYLSLGYLGGDDAGLREIAPYVRAIKKAFDILVAIDALPPKANAWIDRAYAMGADSLCFNLEVFDPKRFDEVCPGPARVIGRQRFLDALEYAATVFPRGAVICHLIVGVEPLESTREGIDALVERGIVPVLPVFRPFKGVDMRAQAPEVAPSTEDLCDLYGYLYQSLQKARISMAWVHNLSVVTTPAEGRFFVEESSSLSARLKRWMAGSRRPSSTLSDWRRALRVKEVDESLKSSGL